MNNKYQTFWARLAAGIIDSLIFFPFVFAQVFWDMTNVRTIIIIESLYLICYTIYTVGGHGIYGYTIGKKIFKVKLLDLSENSTIGISRAFLRESIWIVLTLLYIITIAIKTNFSGYITEQQRMEMYFLDWITLGWLVLEIFTMLTNNKRRALHDYIAKSVVIKV